MSTTKFLAGALVGVAATLLLAPKKGEDMREDLMDTAKGLKKKMGKWAGMAGSELEDLKDMLSEEVQGLSEDARKKILTMLNDAADKASNLKKTATAAM